MLLLASNSPRRKQLIALAGWTFRIAPADIDEVPLPGEPPQNYVLRLAREKAQAAAFQFALDESNGAVIVVAADTTVADGDQILGKPASAAEAEGMLRQLRGRTHQVFTGLAVLRRSDGALLQDVCATDVPMRLYSDAELQAYIASGDPLDKAGAYAIQHPDFRPVERLEGCYPNVMGLPVCRLAPLLAKLGVIPDRRIVAECDPGRVEPCPLYQEAIRAAPLDA
jgi:MAF protein